MIVKILFYRLCHSLLKRYIRISTEHSPSKKHPSLELFIYSSDESVLKAHPI